jgi:hypothetical protein
MPMTYPALVEVTFLDVYKDFFFVDQLTGSNPSAAKAARIFKTVYVRAEARTLRRPKG